MHEFWNVVREIYAALHSGAMPDLGTWSYVALAVLVATEGPLSTLLGAAGAAAGMVDVRWVLVATVCGNVVGDCAWYSVGYLGKKNTLQRYGRYIGIKAHHVERLETGMQAHAIKLIMLSKVAYGLIVPTLVAAGVAKVPFRRWFPAVFVLETLWSCVLVYVGYHAAWLIVDLERGLRSAGAVALFVFVVGVSVFFYRRHRAKSCCLAESVLPQATVTVQKEVHAPRVKSSLPIALPPIIMGETVVTVVSVGETMVNHLSSLSSSVHGLEGVSAGRLEAEPVEGTGWRG